MIDPKDWHHMQYSDWPATENALPAKFAVARQSIEGRDATNPSSGTYVCVVTQAEEIVASWPSECFIGSAQDSMIQYCLQSSVVFGGRVSHVRIIKRNVKVNQIEREYALTRCTAHHNGLFKKVVI